MDDMLCFHRICTYEPEDSYMCAKLPTGDGSKTIVDTIVEELSDSLIRNEITSISSFAELADRYGVSVRTMAKAVAILKQKGLVSVGRGKKMAPVAGEEPKRSSAPKRSSEMLYETIADAIADGRYGCGSALPKIFAMQKLHGVSARTVCTTLKNLERNELIHKHGKAWIVGKRTVDAPFLFVGPPVLFIVHAKPSRWKSIDNPWSMGFYRTFNHECESRGIRTHFYVPSKDRSYNESFPWGVEAMMSEGKQLGDRYRGMLIVGSRKEYRDFDCWLEAAAGLKRPSVWFTTHGADESDMKKIAGDRFLFGCGFSERNFEHTALKHLVDWGHRRIAYIYSSDIEWQRRRAARLSAMCESGSFDPSGREDHRRHLPVYLLLCDAKDDEIGKAAFTDRRIRTPESVPITSIVKGARHERPGWMDWVGPCAYAHSHGCTALLAANDRIAVRIRIAARHLSLQLPKSFSLLSFDNTAQSLLQGISSVDPGFSRLAYRSFHCLSGYIPVKCDRPGQFLTKAFVADRGTIGFPS